jgi:hypothetical protein
MHLAEGLQAATTRLLFLFRVQTDFLPRISVSTMSCVSVNVTILSFWFSSCCPVLRA